MPLDDALRVCLLLLRDKEPASYGRAAVRWIARFALERKDAEAVAMSARRVTVAGVSRSLRAF